MINVRLAQARPNYAKINSTYGADASVPVVDVGWPMSKLGLCCHAFQVIAATEWRTGR